MRTDDHEDDHAAAESFLARIEAAAPRRRTRIAAEAPIAQIQAAARHHPDPFVRRRSLSFLDHHANDASTAVFATALRDPVELVRHMALHAVACETCRTDALCAADVVPSLAEVLATDPSPEIRHKTIPVLLRLADRDPRARRAVESAAADDEDELVREVARGALLGRHVRARKAYARRARRARARAR